MRIVEILDVACREREGIGRQMISHLDMPDVYSGRSGMPLVSRLRSPSPRCSTGYDADIPEGLLSLRWLGSLPRLPIIGDEVR